MPARRVYSRGRCPRRRGRLDGTLILVYARSRSVQTANEFLRYSSRAYANAAFRLKTGAAN
jgi:hypothetical protein